MTDLIFTPILPLPLLLVLGLFIVAIAVWSVLKNLRGIWYRLGACLLVWGCLFNPQITSNDTRPLKDIAIVLVDKSSSQQLGDRRAQTDNTVVEIKKSLSLHSDLEVRFIDITPDGKEDQLGTRAVTALRQALSGIDPDRFAGSILISDGQIHDTDNLSGLEGPLHLLLTGKKNDQDRRLEVIDAPRYGLVDDPLKIRVRVFDNAQLNKDAVVRLTTPDGSIKLFPPSESDVREITFTPKHAGNSVLVIETDPLPNELSTSNNKVALNINGVHDRLRVLLVSGKPHQGQRTWRNILRSDPAVDLVHFTILRPSEKEDFTPLSELSLIAFPVRELFEEKLNDFDLIIFDRYYKHDVLSEGYFQNIDEYVKKGGALLISAGPDFTGPRSLANTRLSDILPAKPSGQILQNKPFHLKRTDIGKRHPITNRLAGNEKDWGQWLRIIESRDYSGQAILESNDQQPILIVDHVKEGRIAMLLSDHIWLWARGFDGGGPHSDLVRHVVHWLMKEPDLDEEKLSLNQIDGANLEIIRQSLSTSPPDVTFTRPDGSEETVKLKPAKNGRSTARVSANTPGIYRANDGKYNAITTLGSLNPKEFMDPRASAEPLEKLIEKVGGTVHWLDDTMPLIKRISAKSNIGAGGWIGLVQNHAETIVGMKKIPLLPVWLIFVAALGLWTLGWWRESR